MDVSTDILPSKTPSLKKNILAGYLVSQPELTDRILRNNASI
jgi:hypothetical protein